MRRPAPLLAVLLLGLLVGMAGPATATPVDGPLDLRIERVTTAPDGETTMAVSVTGLPDGAAPDVDALQVTENGVPVDDLDVTNGDGASEEQVVSGVVVAVDVSGSAVGAPIDAARAAAEDLFREIGSAPAALGLLSFGPTVEVHAPLSDSPAAAIAGLGELEAAGETLLFDGLSRAARMLATHDGPRDVVVFSDGDDNGSTSTLSDVLTVLADTGVRVTTVALESEEYDPVTLATIAEATGGRLLAVDEADELAGAFAAVTNDLRNRLTVTWTAEPVLNPPSELRVEATYAGADSDVVQVLSDRTPAIAPPREIAPPAVPVPALATPSGLTLGASALGLAVLLLLLLAFGVGAEQRRSSRLRRRLSAYGTDGVEAEDAPHASMADRAASVVERVPRPSAADQWITTSIERADWPMRTSEFVLIVTMLVFGLAFVLGVLTGSGAVGLLGAVFGGAAPFVVLTIAVRRRQRAFSDQLSDFLQIMAGALRAGHAFTTALDGAVQEIGEPAATELRRAAVETRLGRPMDRALLGVAERMDSDDLRWVVSAIAVQRTVGGNLAEVLSNVAATLRDRASVRRQVAALSAEGRLSGWAIGAMPFVMFLFLSVQNPDYVALLWERGIGRLMLVVGALLFVVGVAWLRKVVQPKF